MSLLEAVTDNVRRESYCRRVGALAAHADAAPGPAWDHRPRHALPSALWPGCAFAAESPVTSLFSLSFWCLCVGGVGGWVGARSRTPLDYLLDVWYPLLQAVAPCSSPLAAGDEAGCCRRRRLWRRAPCSSPLASRIAVPYGRRFGRKRNAVLLLASAAPGTFPGDGTLTSGNV